jgi:hypothetical protein
VPPSPVRVTIFDKRLAIAGPRLVLSRSFNHITILADAAIGCLAYNAT